MNQTQTNLFAIIMRYMNNARGFTLMELMVVIAIIGILSSVVMVSLQGARERGRDAKRISDIQNLQLALELYYDVNNEYPAQNPGEDDIQTALASLKPNYISEIPDDPTSTKSYYYITIAAPATSYCLGAALEASVNTKNTCNATIIDLPADACDGAVCDFRVGP